VGNRQPHQQRRHSARRAVAETGAEQLPAFDCYKHDETDLRSLAALTLLLTLFFSDGTACTWQGSYGGAVRFDD
jgi:hypothetical protein